MSKAERLNGRQNFSTETSFRRPHQMPRETRPQNVPKTTVNEQQVLDEIRRLSVMGIEGLNEGGLKAPSGYRRKSPIQKEDLPIQ